MKGLDLAGIEIATPGSAVSFTSVTRHVTDCATRPGYDGMLIFGMLIFDQKLKQSAYGAVGRSEVCDCCISC